MEWLQVIVEISCYVVHGLNSPVALFSVSITTNLTYTLGIQTFFIGRSLFVGQQVTRDKKKGAEAPF